MGLRAGQARGRSLGVFDAAIFGVYMAFRWVYPWPFFWTLGADARPHQFSIPRWFLLAVLYGKLLLAAMDWGQRQLPNRLRWVADAALATLVAMLTAFGMCWRDYYHSRWFDLCNQEYHNEYTCSFGKIFFIQRHLDMIRTEAVWMWPEMCFWVAMYIFWFEYSRPLVKHALQVGRVRLGVDVGFLF